MRHLQSAGKRGKYITVAIGILAGYVLFLTSRVWFPGQPDASEFTQLGSQVMVGDTDISVLLVYWAYAPDQAAMLVELDIQADVGADLKFQAVDKAMDQLPLICMMYESGTVVLKITDIPKDFEAVSLRVLEGKEQARLYTNQKQVEQVERLTFYTKIDGYYQARITRNVEALEKEIAAQKDLIQKLDEEISDYNTRIEQTKARLPYLRKVQRTSAEEDIQSLEKQIEKCSDKKQTATDTIAELTSEMEKQQQLKDEKVYETLPEESASEADTDSESDTKEVTEE